MKHLKPFHTAGPSFCALPVALLCLLLPACGGGGSSSGSGAAANFAMHVDTAAGGSDVITAQVLAVSVESVGGSLSGNLLPAPTAVTLVDPSGTTAGLAVRTPAQANVLAIHLMVDGGVAQVLRSDGSRVTAHLPGVDLRVPLTGTLAIGASTPISIGHDTAPNLVPRVGGGFDWTPAMRATVVDDVVMSVADATVMSVDGTAGTMIVTLSGYQDLSFEVVVPATARLVGDDGGGRGRDDFLTECHAGSRLSFEGLGRSSREIECRSAHHHGSSRGELKLIGRINSIDVGASSFVMEVQAAVRRGVPTEPGFTTVTVDASAAVVYASHHSVHLGATFADLRVGALVEVEGGGPVNGILTARSVELEDDRGQHQPGEIEGAVTAVDTPSGTVIVGPRGNDPLLLGGVSVQSVTVTTHAGTVILRRSSGGLTPITVDDITTVDRIWVRGSISAPQTVAADWIRVEAR